MPLHAADIAESDSCSAGPWKHKSIHSKLRQATPSDSLVSSCEQVSGNLGKAQAVWDNAVLELTFRKFGLLMGMRASRLSW